MDGKCERGNQRRELRWIHGWKVREKRSELRRDMESRVESEREEIRVEK